MSFSERYGYKSIKNIMQIESMDSALRNSLWNTLYKKIQIFFDDLYDDLICNFFKEALPVTDHSFDSFESVKVPKLERLKSKFNKLEWFEVYDFIEFLFNSQFFGRNESHIKRHQKELRNEINYYLERENSAYRLVDNLIVRITETYEIDAIEQAINIKIKKFENIKTHLLSALKKMSDKKSPDYRNSIKESISAVETCCRLLTNESTLGKAIDMLEKKGITINNQLKQGFEKLYAYTNSKDSGIRHAIIENSNIPDYEDAKYMLVSCSAFINYLISKTK